MSVAVLPPIVSFTPSEKLSPFRNLAIAALVTFRLIFKVTDVPAVEVTVNTGFVSVDPAFSTTDPPVIVSEAATYWIPSARVTSTSAEVCPAGILN